MNSQARASLALYALKNLYEQNPPNIIEDIAPDEQMHVGDAGHYFDVANSALRGIKLAMLAAEKDTFENILDFGCGHGRVLRILRAAFPDARITACDLIPAAVDYCAQIFGAIPVLSQESPDQIELEGGYDLIWCGTVLTNLNHDSWLGCMNLFHRSLAPDGVLVFTTHGRFVAERIRGGISNYDLDEHELPGLLEEFDQNGFVFRNYPLDFLRRQFPVEIAEYGISIQAPAWVCGQLAQFVGFRLVTFTERGWDNHQDIIACVRDPA
jgi:SAM-dependent methyltransferase